MQPDIATLVSFLSSSYVHMPLPHTHTHLLLFPLYALSPSQPLPSPSSAGGSWFSGWRGSTHHHYCWLLLCVLVLQKTERSVYHCILLSTTLNYYHYHCQLVYCAMRHDVLGEQWYISFLSFHTVVRYCDSPGQKSNVIPLHISTTLPRLKHCSAEISLRAGLIHTA